MSLFTDILGRFNTSVEEEIVAEKKGVTIPDCQYNRGVACQENKRKCNICGWNPVVAEMRKQAIRMGNKHFLRLSDRGHEPDSDAEVRSL